MAAETGELARLRPTSAVALSVVAWAMCALLMGQAALVGRLDVAWRFAPGMATIAWLVGVVFFAPHISVRPDVVVVRNVWRTTTLPYSRILDVRVGAGVRLLFEPPGGQKWLHCWNAPGLSRAPNPPWRPGAETPDPLGPAGVLVEAWRARSGADEDAPVESRIHVAELVVTLALIAGTLSRALW